MLSFFRAEPQENLLYDLSASFLEVFYVKRFEQRHPPHIWIFIQADIQRRWSEPCAAQRPGHQSEQQHRSAHHHDPCSPRAEAAAARHCGTAVYTGKSDASAPSFSEQKLLNIHASTK